MKVKEYIARFLEAKEIDTVFLLQGGMITNLVDSIHEITSILGVTVQHEQAAAMAVDAYGKVSHKPAVALATSGPGATNLITGIASCFFDSVPAIFITGQVNTTQLKRNPFARQTGFQETDIINIAAPITKAVFSVWVAYQIPDILEKAYALSMQGRPGPVLIDIPIDIQMQEMNDLIIPIDDVVLSEENKKESDLVFFKKYYVDLQKSKRPLILVGGGVRSSSELFKEFLHRYQIPVVLSLLGLDVLPYTHPERVGFIGTYGNRWANTTLADCDLLLVLGSRMDSRQTASIKEFKQGKKIYHIDIDYNELNNNITGCETSEADLSLFFEDAIALNRIYKAPVKWKNTIQLERDTNSDTSELDCKGINPNVFIHELSKSSGLAKGFTTDVGANQMWSAQSIELSKNQFFLTSGGMGAMGYSLPAAIGACFASGISPVVAIVGDGGMQINIQELQTIRRYNLPIKIVVLNNRSLGMIRQFQDAYFGGRHVSTVDNPPSFVNIASAYEIERYYIESEEDIQNGLERMWMFPNSPFLLEVFIDTETNISPKVMFGDSLKSK